MHRVICYENKNFIPLLCFSFTNRPTTKRNTLPSFSKLQSRLIFLFQGSKQIVSSKDIFLYNYLNYLLNISEIFSVRPPPLGQSLHFV